MGPWRLSTALRALNWVAAAGCVLFAISLPFLPDYSGNGHNSKPVSWRLLLAVWALLLLGAFMCAQFARGIAYVKNENLYVRDGIRRMKQVQVVDIVSATPTAWGLQLGLQGGRNVTISFLGKGKASNWIGQVTPGDRAAASLLKLAEQLREGPPGKAA